jgi:glycosyltransferase involved in cell wall biosynthesis
MSRSMVTDVTAPTPGALGRDGLFLVWGPSGHGPRSRAFGRALGMDVVFVSASRRRGPLAALYKYPVQGARTLALLFRRRPRVVFVQSPPSFAVLAAWAYALAARRRFVVDAHSCAMRSVFWTRPRWLYRTLTRSAAATIVTNDHYAASLRAEGGTSLVIRDVPQEPVPDRRRDATGPFTVMVVNTFAPDEPLGEILDAAAALPDVVFSVTGDPARVGRELPPAPPNVRFTGFLPEDGYRELMATSGAVMCLTTHDHTMQRGACEALWAGRPIITSDWALLRDYFDRGTVHVENSASSIRDAVMAIAADGYRYEREIADLQTARLREWEEAVAALAAALDDHTAAHGMEGGAV